MTNLRLSFAASFGLLLLASCSTTSTTSTTSTITPSPDTFSYVTPNLPISSTNVYTCVADSTLTAVITVQRSLDEITGSTPLSRSLCPFLASSQIQLTYLGVQQIVPITSDANTCSSLVSPAPATLSSQSPTSTSGSGTDQVSSIAASSSVLLPSTDSALDSNTAFGASSISASSTSASSTSASSTSASSISASSIGASSIGASSIGASSIGASSISTSSTTASDSTVTFATTVSLPTGVPSSGDRLTGSLASSAATISTLGSTSTPIASIWYDGDGSSPPWPAPSDWVQWPTMWDINRPYVGKSCVPGASGEVPQSNSDDESETLREAIEFYSKSSLVDPRLIYATILAESQGCVRAVTTFGAVANPGLMQSHDGDGTCFNITQQIPCPAEVVYQMVYDGTQASLDNTLVSVFNQRTSSGCPKSFYEGFRLYNSGQYFVLGNNLSTNLYEGPQGVVESGRAGYVSEIANRLRGWNGVY